MNLENRDPALGERVFYLNEHLPRSLVEEMRKRGFDTHLVIDLGLEGTDDIALLLELAGRADPGRGWVLITCDSRMPRHFQDAVGADAGMTAGAVAVMEGLDETEGWMKQRRILRWIEEVAYQPPKSAWRYHTNQCYPVL